MQPGQQNQESDPTPQPPTNSLLLMSRYTSLPFWAISGPRLTCSLLTGQYLLSPVCRLCFTCKLSPLPPELAAAVSAVFWMRRLGGVKGRGPGSHSRLLGRSCTGLGGLWRSVLLLTLTVSLQPLLRALPEPQSGCGGEQRRASETVSLRLKWGSPDHSAGLTHTPWNSLGQAQGSRTS